VGSTEKTWQQRAVELDALGFSWRAIGLRLKKPKSTVSDFLRSYEVMSVQAAPLNRVDDDKEDNSRVLIISDMHIPYHHPNLLPFLAGLKAKYKPTRVICVGDELDKHAMSFHDSDPDLDSAGKELEKARAVVAKLEKLFPRMDIIDSNHGSMLYRRAKAHGIPRQYLKTYNDVLGVGDGWRWHYDLTIKLPDGRPVYFHHGKSVNGLRLSQAMGMSCVQGHFHEQFRTEFWANPLGLYFSMQVGCLIDDDSYAFAYNNVNLKRPIIGTGLIIDSKPVLEPMQL
jgi:hypothetical protein